MFVKQERRKKERLSKKERTFKGLHFRLWKGKKIGFTKRY